MMKAAVLVALVLIFASLGEASRCPACFSRESFEDCNASAQLKTCEGLTSVCMMYQSTARKDGTERTVYLRYCTYPFEFNFKKRYCSKPKMIKGLGEVTCHVEESPILM
ncbi:hypothetical protein OS493_011236 [Desmophyllum pertusum]|uniref:Uncharacterized protein n=1 Tax=Desmophyllum pertusum TaxID=174260 RepID=A0A9W9Z4J9_9CNID|nr:hypothetical protein OS493_011236 [Desmophyllum pertusum]